MASLPPTQPSQKPIGFVIWDEEIEALRITWKTGQELDLHVIDVFVPDIQPLMGQRRLLMGFVARGGAIAISYRLETHGPIQYSCFGPEKDGKAILAVLLPQYPRQPSPLSQSSLTQESKWTTTE